MEEEEKGEITLEELYEGLKAAMILACFEKEFGPAPHPLRRFKLRRWMRDFEAFRKGVLCGEMVIQKMSMRKAEKKRRIEMWEKISEEVNARDKHFYVSVDDDGDLVVMEQREDGDDVVVSDKFETKFMLCSGRCVRKEHYGEFDGKVFKCYFYE